MEHSPLMVGRGIENTKEPAWRLKTCINTKMVRIDRNWTSSTLIHMHFQKKKKDNRLTISDAYSNNEGFHTWD